jgi:hypothetical protein
LKRAKTEKKNSSATFDVDKTSLNSTETEETRMVATSQKPLKRLKQTSVAKKIKLKKVTFKKSKCVCDVPQMISGTFERTGPYTQIGAFPTVELLKDHFYKIHIDHPQNSIKFQLLIFVDNLSPSSFENYCKPFSNIYHPDINEKVTVFFKKNETSCIDHFWTVLSVWDHYSLLKHPDIEDLKKLLLNDIPQSAHFEQNKRTNDNIDCDCNGTEKENPLGANFHSGCHQGAGHSTKCKFFKFSNDTIICAKFKLTEENYKTSRPTNNELLENTTHKIVDNLLTPLVVKWASSAADNMEKHLKKATDCQIGTSKAIKKCFTCIAMNFDYCSHIHKDRNDLTTGVTALLSIERTNKPQQVHFYPTYTLPNSTNPGPGFGFYIGDTDVVIEVSSLETHGASKVESPNRLKPSHVSVVAFCGKVCDLPKHGYLKKDHFHGIKNLRYVKQP